VKVHCITTANKARTSVTTVFKNKRSLSARTVCRELSGASVTDPIQCSDEEPKVGLTLKLRSSLHVYAAADSLSFAFIIQALVLQIFECVSEVTVNSKISTSTNAHAQDPMIKTFWGPLNRPTSIICTKTVTVEG
jgi:hypothetical protein